MGTRNVRGWGDRLRLALLPAAAVLLASAALHPARSAAQDAPAPNKDVIIRTDQVDGRLVSDSVTNTSVEAVYGQTTSPLADAAFQWVRATNALSYVRCYNWLGDGIPKNRPEWFSGCRVVRSAGGQIVYRWEGLERVLDTLVASGVKPYIVCGGIPDALAAGPIKRNEGGQAINRPKDYAQYQDMIAQMMRRLVKTYGEEEVRTWYFEVWSQPDHEGSWDGGRPAPFKEDTTDQMVAPFNRLYDHFAAGALSVDEKIRIGGPGLAGDLAFFRKFLAHCARGTNAATGKPGARLDFISWHRYGTVSDIVRWNAELRGIVEKDFPELKGAQFILSECGSGPVEGSRASSSYEAARMAALLDANARAEKGVDLMFRTGDLVDDHFDGFRPLITQIGQNTLPLPAFRLFMLLSKMGTERLKSEAPAGFGVVGARTSVKGVRNATQALVYRYDPSVLPGSGEPQTVKVRFTGLPSNLLRLPARVYRIDPEHHAVHEAWEKAGSLRPSETDIETRLREQQTGKPSPNYQRLLELGTQLVGKTPFAPDEENLGVFVNSGEIVMELKLPPNSVALVTVGAEPGYDVELSKRGERVRRAEEEFNTAAEERRIGPPMKAMDAFQKVREKYADTFWAETALYSMAGIFELDLRSPGQAESARRELLKLPLDDFTRLRVLERLRVDAARGTDKSQLDQINREIAGLEQSLAAQRQWTVKRYLGQ